MNKTIAVAVGLLMLVLLLLFSTTYTVKYSEVAIKQTFGQDTVVTEPGLHFRMPVFIDKVTKLDKRLQVVESPQEEIITDDDLQVVVRAFMLWKIDVDAENGPSDFFNKMTSTDEAGHRLQSPFRTAFTGILSGYRFGDLIGPESKLERAEQEILAAMTAQVSDLGVKPVTVGISQVILPTSTAAAVLTRMQADRDVLAEGERKVGISEAESLRSDGNTKAEKIRSFATVLAAEIRASGEDAAAEYLKQMNEDAGLAMFLISLDHLGRALSQRTTVILPAQTLEPFHLMDPSAVTYIDGLPRAKNGSAVNAAVKSADEMASMVRALARRAAKDGETEAATYLDTLTRGEHPERLFAILAELRRVLADEARDAAVPPATGADAGAGEDDPAPANDAAPVNVAATTEEEG